MLLKEVLAIRLVLAIVCPTCLLAQLSTYMQEILADISPGKKGHNKLLRRKSEDSIAPGDPLHRTGIHHRDYDVYPL